MVHAEQSATLIDSLMAEEISGEERRLLDLAADLRERGLKSESCNAYWDVLAINPRNETAQAALRKMRAEVTVTGLVPAPVDGAQLRALEDDSDSLELVEPEEIGELTAPDADRDSRRAPSIPRHRTERIRIPSRARPASSAPRPPARVTSTGESPAMSAPAEPDVLAALTGDLDPSPAGVSRTRSRVALVTLVVAVAGLLAMVWDTRRELSALSSELRAQRTTPAAASAPTPGPRTVPLTFGAATSIDYEAPLSGFITTRAEPGAVLQPGDLVAEIMPPRAYRRLSKARARYRWFKRRAKHSPAARRRARRAKADAIRAWRRGRKAHVRAVQRGIARPAAELGRVEAGSTVMKLEIPAMLSAELPPMDDLDVNATCRFTGEAEDAPCRLVFERGAGHDRVRVMLSNGDGRFLPGQSLDVVIEPGQKKPG